MNPTPVRSIQTDDDKYLVEGLLIPFTGPLPGNLDSYGTRFGPDTDYCLSWFRERPLLYGHAQNSEIGRVPVGTITNLSIRDNLGLWMQAELDRQSQWFDALRQLVEEDKMFLSSGSMEHLVKCDTRTGQMLVWPVIEGSMTTAPANTHAFVMPAPQFRSACREAGFGDIADKLTDESDVLSPEAFRAKMNAKERDTLPDSDFAYVDSEGKRHLPINDEAHAKDALARFDQTEFESDAAKTAAKEKILAACKKFGVDVSSEDDAKREAPEWLRAANLTSEMLAQLPDWALAEHPLVAFRGTATDGAVSLYEKSFEDIASDINEQLNPCNPFGPQTSYSYVVATYPDHVIVKRIESSDPYGSIICYDGDTTLWKIPYTLDDTLEPQLGTPEQVEKAFLPVSARSAAGSLSLDAQRFIRHAAGLLERTQDLRDRRLREGRVLSAANRQTLKAAHEAMGKAHEALGTFLSSTEPMPTNEAARAADETHWQGLVAEFELLTALL